MNGQTPSVRKKMMVEIYESTELNTTEESHLAQLEAALDRFAKATGRTRINILTAAILQYTGAYYDEYKAPQLDTGDGR